MTTPMPTIFDVKAQAEESDYFEPTAADYAGDPDYDYPACPICGDPIDYCLGHADQCRECGRDLAPDSVSYHCDSCDNELYFEAAMMDRFDAKFGI